MSGTAEIHSRLVDVGGGGNYSENPTMAASFTYTKGLSFIGFVPFLMGDVIKSLAACGVSSELSDELHRSR